MSSQYTYKSKIDDKLKIFLNTDLNYFKKILLKNEAYISGGFLLSAITNSFETSDIDIYINEINFNTFIKDLKKLNNFRFNTYSDPNLPVYQIDDDYYNTTIEYDFFYNSGLQTKKNIGEELYCSSENSDFDIAQYRTDWTKRRKRICNLVIASEYDLSFFKKNGIKFKIEVFINNYKCDIMVLNKNRKILDVVTNFDLTCCQLWYNGSKFGGTHLKDISNKICYLNPDYLESLIKQNYFILNRINKYKERGFDIYNTSLDISNIDISLFNVNTYNKYEIIDVEKFLVKIYIDFERKRFNSLLSLLNNNYNSTNNKYVYNIVSLPNMITKFKRNTLSIIMNELEMFKPSNKILIDNGTKESYDKLECDNICYLDFELNKIKNLNVNQSDIIYETLLNYINSFTNFTFNELISNTYLYFGISIIETLKFIDVCFNSTYDSYFKNDSTKQKIFMTRAEYLKKKEKFKYMCDKLKDITKKVSQEEIDEQLNQINLLTDDINNKYNLTYSNKLDQINVDQNRIINLKGDDVINMEYNINIRDYIEKNEDNMCFINIVDDENGNINYYPYLITRTDLMRFLLDKNSGWFYKCNRPDSIADIDRTDLYIKIPFELIMWVYYSDLCYILKNKLQIVFFKYLINIKHSVSHDLVYPNEPGSQPNFVSSKHCQEGSNIYTYTAYQARNLTLKAKSISKSKSKEFSLKVNNINIVNKNKLKSTKSLSPKKKSKSVSKTDKSKAKSL